MPYLSHYTEKAKNEAYKQFGAFHAFSNKQFEEQRKEGVKYVHMGQNLICPKKNVQKFFEALEKAHMDGIAADKAENGQEAIIRRELSNYEVYWGGSLDDVVDALNLYGEGYKREDILPIYRKRYKEMQENNEF